MGGLVENVLSHEHEGNGLSPELDLGFFVRFKAETPHAQEERAVGMIASPLRATRTFG